MSEFTLRFKTDNGIFHEDGLNEVTRILKAVTAKLSNGADYGKVFDINGNSIGEFCLDLPETEEE